MKTIMKHYMKEKSKVLEQPSYLQIIRLLNIYEKISNVQWQERKPKKFSDFCKRDREKSVQPPKKVTIVVWKL